MSGEASVELSVVVASDGSCFAGVLRRGDGAMRIACWAVQEDQRRVEIPSAAVSDAAVSSERACVTVKETPDKGHTHAT